MSTPTPLNKKGNYFSLTSKISFLRQRRTRTSQGLQQQTQKQPSQLRERQSALARKLPKDPYYSNASCDDSMTKTSLCETELTSTATVSSAIFNEQVCQIVWGKTNPDELAAVYQHAANTCVYFK